MRRRGKRYLLNKNTNELHDLDKETENCQISEIKDEHIMLFDSEREGLLYQAMIMGKQNGCFWCNRNNQNG